MAMKRSSAHSPTGLPSQFVDEVFSAEYPTLYEWLRESKWDDGATRKTGAVMILVDGSYLKAWVHDKDGRRSAWVSAESFSLLLQAVDSALAEGRLEWRADKR